MGRVSSRRMVYSEGERGTSAQGGPSLLQSPEQKCHRSGQLDVHVVRYRAGGTQGGREATYLQEGRGIYTQGIPGYTPPGYIPLS